MIPMIILICLVTRNPVLWAFGQAQFKTASEISVFFESYCVDFQQSILQRNVIRFTVDLLVNCTHVNEFVQVL